VACWWSEHWHDVLDVVAVMATVAAAFLAWWAIRRGNKQAKDAADAHVRERRINFELEQLDRIDAAISGGAHVGVRKSSGR
jgi:hypothetical protein